MEIVGIDVGFGFTKAYNGKNSVIFKSVIGDSTDIQFKSSIGESKAASNLHVTIDDKSYFIGNYAELQSNVREFTLDQEKLLTDFVKVLAVTAAGICCEESTSLKVVSGLPVGFLKRDYKKFTELLIGQHDIIYHNADGRDVNKHIQIHKVHLIPQPVGSIFNLIMDDNGKISDRALSLQKLGVVDIGFRTTDFSVFDHLQYVERSSTTMDTGISKCFSIVANKLRQESGVNIELYRMYKYMDKGTVKIRGKEYNISNLKKRVYSHAASAISNDLNRLWEDDWDIDTIILSGGGGKELSEHLQGQIAGNLIPIPNNQDARFNNVQGYLKFGRYKWKYNKKDDKKDDISDTKTTTALPMGKNNIESTESTESKKPKESKGREPQSGTKGLGWLKR